MASTFVGIGQDKDVVAEHVRLLLEADYLQGHMIEGLSGVFDDIAIINGISWEGHDFIDAVKSDNIWAKTKERALAAGGGFSIEVFKALAIRVAKDTLGLP